jgi:hypothetical protein
MYLWAKFNFLRMNYFARLRFQSGIGWGGGGEGVQTISSLVLKQQQKMFSSPSLCRIYSQPLVTELKITKTLYISI